MGTTRAGVRARVWRYGDREGETRPDTGTVWVVRVTGELDRDGLPAVRRALRRTEPGSGADHDEVEGVRGVVMDLSGLVFADSAALHVLAEARRAGGTLRRVLPAGPLRLQVARLFEVTGAGTGLSVAPSVASAVVSLLGVGTNGHVSTPRSG
ncbi:STAS domain-containing protein (plasmid) [Streptomyces sp. BI20]|uniref:STAS domain-containing protein n=1 Tax=Streptomyces sp. BI20 TaxID=3403460 RepID=UPI003C731993